MRRPTLKPNIFALPNQTTLLFGMMVAIIWGVILAGSIEVSPVSIRALAVVLFLLPMRSFLAHPEKLLKQLRLIPASKEFAFLQQQLVNYAHEIGLPRPPQLVLGKDTTALQTFGSFRHWYLAMGITQAIELEKGFNASPPDQIAEATLLHELYHFKTGDYWQLGYARELLRLTGLVMIWALGFSLGYGLLLLNAQPAILQMNPAELFTQIQTTTPEPLRAFVDQLLPVMQAQIVPLMETARQKAEVISIPLAVNFVLGATYPFALMGFVLWLLYWRKLWRLREYYADAGSAHTQQHTTGIRAVFQTEQALIPSRRNWREWLPRFLRLHASPQERVDVLQNPAAVFASWRGAAILAGSLAIVLEILMMTPLTLLYVGRFPMHPPVLAIFLMISFNYLLPAVAQGQPVFKPLLKIISVVTGMRLTIVLIGLGLFWGYIWTAPGVLAEILSMAILVTSRAGVIPPQGAKTDLLEFIVHMTWSNLAQVVIVALILVTALLITSWLVRRMFTWYGLPHAERRLMKLMYGVIAGIAGWLAFSGLPFITALLLAPENLSHPILLACGLIGSCLALAGIGYFFSLDRLYHHRCPACGAPVAGNYELGKMCPACQTLLHPWLIATYAVKEEMPA